MSAILAAVLKMLSDAFGSAIADMVATWTRDTANRDLGASRAQIALDAEIKDAADEQAKLNAADRGGAADVLARLRAKP